MPLCRQVEHDPGPGRPGTVCDRQWRSRWRQDQWNARRNAIFRSDSGGSGFVQQGCRAANESLTFASSFNPGWNEERFLREDIHPSTACSRRQQSRGLCSVAPGEQGRAGTRLTGMRRRACHSADAVAADRVPQALSRNVAGAFSCISRDAWKSAFEPHGEVHRLDVLRQAAYGDAVDAGLCDGADVLQSDAAGRLQFRAVAGDIHGLAHLF